jgi:chemotaxis protein CheD
MKKISVGIAEMQIAQAPDTLISYGFGSCIGIAIFDPNAKIGGLVHAMLCASGGNTPPGNPLKYVDSAVDVVLSELLDAGCSRGALLAKMAGGAHMFECSSSETGSNIGERNAEAARKKLEELGIPLVAEDVGGVYGRTIELDPRDGVLTVRSIRKGTKRI